MTVVGSEKMVVYDEVDPERRVVLYDRGIDEGPPGATGPPRPRRSLGRYETFGEYQLMLRAGDVLIPRIDFVEPLRLQCQHFVDRVVDGAEPLTGGSSGLAVVEALEAAQRAIDTGLPVDIA
jgi:predicted dehydrogenase